MVYNLDRFLPAQQADYHAALREIRGRKKQGHWMWYIFPQLKGLGRSSTSQYYGIQGFDEAIAFLRHDTLGHNLQQITEALYALDTDDPYQVFGNSFSNVDVHKLKSSMTLFCIAENYLNSNTANNIFRNVLQKFFGGKADRRTQDILLREAALTSLCRSSSTQFTNRERLDKLDAILCMSDYLCIRQSLFQMYVRKPLSELPTSLTLVSSHVDCEYNISRCFYEDIDKECFCGTFDNSATNLIAARLILDSHAPENTVFVFTGDEEEDGGGIISAAKYLQKAGKQLRGIVLDVTDYGWDRGAMFTIENNFWDGYDSWGSTILRAAQDCGFPWNFIPDDEQPIPKYAPKDSVLMLEPCDDESWDLDELDIPCFSLCIPVLGEMHSDTGVLLRKDSLTAAKKVLQTILAL